MANTYPSQLPWIQSLAGLFGGLVNSRQQHMANPRFQPSALPIIAGGMNGLVTALSGIGQRNELVRQENRSFDDAVANYMLATGLPKQVVVNKLEGLKVKDFQTSIADAMRNGVGSQTLARTMGLENPGQYYGVDQANPVFSKAADALSNAGTLAKLPGYRSQGLYDTGAAGSGNDIPLYTAPSVSRLFGPLTNIFGNPPNSNEAPAGIGVSLPPGPSAGPIAGPADEPANLRGSNGETIVPLGDQTVSGSVAKVSQPLTLGEVLRQGADPRLLVAQYGAASDAAASRNSQVTQRFTTAQQIRSQNERAVLDHYTQMNQPSIAKILMGDNPNALGNLMGYAQAQGVARSGIKPPTPAEIRAAYSDIGEQRSAEGALATTEALVQSGVDPKKAQQVYNATRAGKRDPLTDEMLQNAGLVPGGAPATPAPTSGGSVIDALQDVWKTLLTPTTTRTDAQKGVPGSGAWSSPTSFGGKGASRYRIPAKVGR